ncbi:MAG: hypothetical protein ACLFO1_06495 [Spirochaetaceae bacterium]
MARRVRLIATLAAVLLVLFFGLMAGLRIAGVTAQDLLENAGILTVEHRASAELVSRDVRSLAELNTVRYTMQRIFPYDFMGRGLSDRQVQEKLSSSTRPAEEILSAAELRYWRAYNIALEAGMDPRPEAAEFVVVTTTLYVGYPVDALRESVDDADGHRDAADSLVTLDTRVVDGEERREAVVRLPEPTILNVVVQDVKPEEYPYPDVAISPDAWRRIARFVAEQSKPATVREELFSRARSNAEELIRRVLTQAGIHDVVFVTPKGFTKAD